MTNPFKRRLVVKPVHPYERDADNPGWLVMQANMFEDFVDDWKRAGARVAFHNFFWELFK